MKNILLVSSIVMLILNNQTNLVCNRPESDTHVKEIDSKPPDNYFELVSATSTTWTAGIPSGGSGTEFYFKIKITTEEKITFERAWINNKSFEIFISKETSSVSNLPIEYGSGDIITLRVSDLKNSNTKSININPPIQYNGAALIGYSIKGDNEYFTIKEIKKQSSPNRP